MRIGKQVRGDVYLHRSACHHLPQADLDKVEAACGAIEAEWNVVRVSTREVSLLHYPGFDEEPFPALLGAVLVRDGVEAARTDYGGRSNPPVLHRKELLVAPDHPKRHAWAAATSRLEAAGAFADPHRIGTRDAWRRRLEELGLGDDGRARRP